jgi:hypothetical protein
MNRNTAKKLARYHSFTKIELYNMLVEALDTFSDDYWTKPNKVNHIFDNGYYFNQCVKWVGYEQGKNDNAFNEEIVVVRVLEVFGKFSVFQIPKKVKPEIKIQVSEKPHL